MLKVCVYGTVFNNASYLERSIPSVFSPEYDIVIVDNYSTDGTWEKLLEMRKDFNLHLYRYKCSRGLGRNIALHKCQEGSITAYFDLDTVYYKDFHRIINAAEEYGSVSAGGTLAIKRELAIKRGGWKNMNAGEDIDFAVRMNANAHVPVVLGENANPERRTYDRERRYAKKLDYLKRMLRVYIEHVKGNGYDMYSFFAMKSKGLLLFSPLLIPYLLSNKRNRYCRGMTNYTCLYLANLSRLLSPKAIGAEEKNFVFIVDKFAIKILGGADVVDNILANKVGGRIYKLVSKSALIRILYIKDFSLLKHFSPVASLIKKVELLSV